MKAWRTTLYGVVSIVAPESRGAAKAQTFRSADEAGFEPAFQKIRAVRAYEHDEWARDPKNQGRCVAEEHVS